jgi:hypothetical protein
MIIKVETAQEMALIRGGKTTCAVITDRARRTRPGQEIKFWFGDPRTKKQAGGAVNFGIGKVSEITDIEIKHTIQALQKVGELYIAGFKQSFDDASRIARSAGFANLQEMFRQFDFKHTGRLVSWKSVQPVTTTTE